MTKPDTVLHASLTGRRRLVKESVASSTNVPFGASCSIRNKRSVRTWRGWCCGSFGLSGHIGGRELVVCALRTYKKQFTILMYHNSIYLYKKCIFPQTQIRGSRSRAALKVTWTVAFAHPVASYHGLTGDLFTHRHSHRATSRNHHRRRVGDRVGGWQSSGLHCQHHHTREHHPHARAHHPQLPISL